MTKKNIKKKISHVSILLIIIFSTLYIFDIYKSLSLWHLAVPWILALAFFTLWITKKDKDINIKQKSSIRRLK